MEIFFQSAAPTNHDQMLSRAGLQTSSTPTDLTSRVLGHIVDLSLGANSTQWRRAESDERTNGHRLPYRSGHSNRGLPREGEGWPAEPRYLVQHHLPNTDPNEVDEAIGEVFGLLGVLPPDIRRGRERYR